MFHRKLGEHFAIKLDALGFFQSDEFSVCDAAQAQSRVQASNPEPAEIAFFGTSIASGIGTGFDESFLGLRKKILASPTEPFGGFQDIFMAFLGHYAALDSGHKKKSEL